MNNIEYKWFACIRNSIDLIEDSQIFSIPNVFHDQRLNDLIRIFGKNIKTKKHIRTALKESFSELERIYPQNDLKQVLYDSKGSQRNVKSYEEEIFSRYAKNDMANIGNDLSCAPTRTEDYQHILDDAKARLSHIEEGMSSDVEMTKEQSYEILQKKLADMNNPNPEMYIKAGIKKIDDAIIGFQKRTNIVIASRPSIGKTAAGLTVALNARRQGKKVAFVSVEMTNDKIFSRACFNNGNLQSDRFNPGGVPTAEDFKTLNQSANDLIRDENFILINPVRRTIGDVARSMRKCKRENPDLDMIVVDYLQKVQGSDKRADPVTQIKEVMGTLTDLCKSLNIVLITLAQLNRDADENAVPQQRHLKGASDIEQDADMIFLLHRSRDAQKEAQATGSTRKPVAKGVEADQQTLRGLQTLWILDKNRDGQTGSFLVYYDAPVMRFNNDPNGEFVDPFEGEGTF